MDDQQASFFDYVLPLGSKHYLPEIFNFVHDVANNNATVLTPKSVGREDAKGETGHAEKAGERERKMLHCSSKLLHASSVEWLRKLWVGGGDRRSGGCTRCA